MKASLKTGFSFGLTSAIITTLGLMVGLLSGTHSRAAVIGGVLTVAIADAFSDALGIHVSQESQGKYSAGYVWEATLATFLAKSFFAATFVLPVLFLELLPAVKISVFWGLLLLSVFSFLIGWQKKRNGWKTLTEHLVIALAVILLSYFIGNLIAAAFE